MRRFNLLLAPLLYAVGSIANPEESELSKETAKANNESLLWGPYKPNLYFGVRPRLPDSFFAGLMWSKVDDFVGAQQSRCFLSHNSVSYFCLLLSC